MPAPTFFAISRQRGFTLVETIIIMVVVGIAAAGVTVMTSNIFNGQDANKTLQIGMKVAQECAEQVLATQRAGALNKVCTSFDGFTVVVDTTTNYAGTGTAVCPTGKTCTVAKIKVTTPGNDALTPLALLLVSAT